MMLDATGHFQRRLTLYTRVRPSESEIKYLKIEVHNPYREDLIELNGKS